MEIYTAAVEMGQGLDTILTQIARSELGVDEVVMHAADTLIGSAGSTSASRQSMMSGGAVKMACTRVRDEIVQRAQKRLGTLTGSFEVTDGALRSGGAVLLALEELLDVPIEAEVEYHHRPTEHFDENGQGAVHAHFSFGAERAVVEVDVETGLVRVVQIAAAIDAGKVMNPLGFTGQVEGGTAQGIGLALTEEVVVSHGVIRNASFTDYLIPTILDAPPVVTVAVEEPDDGTPYGLKGIGEMPTIVSTAAVVAALRDATGRELNRAPVSPDELVGLRGPSLSDGPPPVPEVPGQEPVPWYHGMGSGQQDLM